MTGQHLADECKPSSAILIAILSNTSTGLMNLSIMEWCRVRLDTLCCYDGSEACACTGSTLVDVDEDVRHVQALLRIVQWSCAGGL
ncbi:hypothetical protein FA95DRAFT_511957 [Auriscalpium vulgare]|uniref:Uncharacterized protein n=1 Tax=Auriscalpium vulgare TaxID=40419 RepID=A0ACB8RG26_9AGAM|nr:hypothetical protein FA95DRAFT_511957 [Auriscalpium vulgare]